MFLNTPEARAPSTSAQTPNSEPPQMHIASSQLSTYSNLEKSSSWVDMLPGLAGGTWFHVWPVRHNSERGWQDMVPKGG